MTIHPPDSVESGWAKSKRQNRQMKAYRIVDLSNSQLLRDSLKKNGQILLQMVELIERSRMAIDELIDVLGRASIEAVLQLSAQGVAGEKQRAGRKSQLAGMGRRPAASVCRVASCGSVSPDRGRGALGRIGRSRSRPTRLSIQTGRWATESWRS